MISTLKTLLLLIALNIYIQGTTQNQRPKIVWQIQTQGSIRGAATVHQDLILFGNSSGGLYAVNKSSGAILWTFQTNGAIVSSPTVDRSTIYISSRDGKLYALNLKGKLLWSFQMGSDLRADHGGWKYFSATPVIAGNQVFIGSGDGHLYALNKKDGKVNWKYLTGGRIRTAPAVSNGIIYQPSHDGKVYGIDINNGKLMWEFATLGASLDPTKFSFDRKSIYDQPTILEGKILFGSRDGNMYSVDLETREVIWKFSYGPTWAMASTIHQASAYVGWSTNNLVCSIDLETGKENWSFKAEAHNYSAPLIIGNNVYFTSADGKFYKLDKQTGAKLWDLSVNSEIYAAPIHDNSVYYFGDDKGTFYAIQEQSFPLAAVYQPDSIKGNAQYLVVDPQLTPYLLEKGFRRLNESSLNQFVRQRIEDKEPSVIVFSLPIVPSNVMGEDPTKGLLRQYLETGGKVVWMGDVPNFYDPDSTGNFKRSAATGSSLLDVEYEYPTESGNYYSKTTSEGLKWGFPSWTKSTHAIVKPSGGIIVLGYDEFGRVSTWNKPFNSRTGSGFVSFRPWGWNVPAKEREMELIYKISLYGLFDK